jgi:nitroreductase
MLNDLSTPLSFLATRRSGKPRDMVAPGPSEAEVRKMVALATRVPDHGKIAPWRFVVVPLDARERLAALMVDALAAEKPDAKAAEIEAARQFAHQAPTLVVVLSSPKRDRPIPLWEQELSAGAASLALVQAATAMGYVAGWLTGWAAFSPMVTRAFGNEGDRIAGFVFIGSPGRPLEERPRPDVDEVLSTW